VRLAIRLLLAAALLLAAPAVSLSADVDRSVSKLLSRLGAAGESASPDVDPSRKSGASEAPRERKADE